MTNREDFTYTSDVDGMVITVSRWPAPDAKALVVIAHGAAEHVLRYDRFAQALRAAGFETWGMDHRGHGRSPGPEGLGDFGEGGWDALVADIHQLIAIVKERRPGLPVVLFGHSMGSAAGQQFAPEGSASIAALVLSGSFFREAPKEGEPAPVFAPNAPFEPARTPYDWLSRDEAEVDKYIADPLCGFETRRVNRPNARFDAAILSDPERLKRIRPDLPVLLLAGDKDPINDNLKGLHKLEESWRTAGVKQVNRLYYEGGRHEMLNETNRDEVTGHTIEWLKKTLKV